MRSLSDLLQRLVESGVDFVSWADSPACCTAPDILQTDWGMVDVLSDVLGLGDFERLKARAEIFEIGGRKCRLIALEDLIQAKEAMGREKDVLAAKELRAIAAKKSREKN